MHVHGALVALGIHAPDFVHQLAAGENLPRAGEQLEKQVELPLGQGQGGAAAGGGQRGAGGRSAGL